jgi:uncharacterized protein YdaU (DUF1376 family)
MSDRADAWMPLYIADYLRDTQHLSTTEHGAYILLLMKSWIEGGVLPLDERRLARIAGLDTSEWKESGEVILEFFTRAEDGYRHKRVAEELVKAEAKLEQQRAAGRASAAKRALQRGGQREGNGRSTGVATGVPTGSSTKEQRGGQREGQREGNPSPSPKSSLRSDLPATPKKSDKFAGQPEQVRRILEVGRFIAVPNDVHLLWEWLSLSDMELERDIVPIVEKAADAEMATKGRAPFTFKFFDSRVRQKHAEDEAAMAAMRRGRRLIEEQDAAQAAEREANAR